MNQNSMNNKRACAQWDDRCMIDDLLETSKHIAGEYSAYVVEGSNEGLRQVLSTNMDETICDQFQIWQQMQQRGWYQTKPAQPQDILMAKQKFAQTTASLL